MGKHGEMGESVRSLLSDGKPRTMTQIIHGARVPRGGALRRLVESVAVVSHVGPNRTNYWTLR